MRSTTAFLLLLSLAAVAALAQDPPTSGTARTGTINLSRSNLTISAGPFGVVQSTTDSLSGGFQTIDYSKFVGSQAYTFTTIGQCIVTLFPQDVTPPDNTVARTALDAGAVLNITGPNGKMQVPAKQFFFAKDLGGGIALPIPGIPPPPPLYLDPGDYTVDNDTGGADVGPFTASITLPPTFAWTNPDAAMAIDRTAGVDITWTGGDPTTKVLIGGAVVVLDPKSEQPTSGGVYACTEDNSAGHFMIPPEVLTLLPASTTANGVSNAILTVSNGVSSTFDAPAIDNKVLTFSSSFVRNIAYN